MAKANRTNKSEGKAAREEKPAARTKETGKSVGPSRGQEVQTVTPARMLSPFEEMERLFEGVFPRRMLSPFRMEWPSLGEMGLPFEGRMPRVDVIDREHDILVRAEVPGVDKKDLDISATGNTVTLRGTTSHEEKEEREDYYRSEISRGSFSRTVALPAEIDESKAKASFKDGILELTLPKSERAKRRRITVE